MDKTLLNVFAREAGYEHTESVGVCEKFAYFDIERFAELVAEAERQSVYKERGILLFNPYNGYPRRPEDIKSDPHGILMPDPDLQMMAYRKSSQ